MLNVSSPQDTNLDLATTKITQRFIRCSNHTLFVRILAIDKNST